MSSLLGIEDFHCIQRCPRSRVLEERGSTVYRGVLAPGCWKRGVPLYTEVSSLQGVGREGFHCVQRCPHSRVLEERGSTVCIQRCPHSRVLEERGSTVYRGVLTSGCSIDIITYRSMECEVRRLSKTEVI